MIQLSIYLQNQVSMIAHLARSVWVQLGWVGVSVLVILVLLLLRFAGIRSFRGLKQMIKYVCRMAKITKWSVGICYVIGHSTYFLYSHYSTEPIPVHIVEEHHEVLLKWFEAVAQGKIFSNVTLMHIDGHLELTLPQYVSGMQAFQQPSNDEMDISKYIQRNDMFITAAAINGLVSRIIWIWPSWNKNHMQNRDEFVESTIHLGWYEPPDSSNTPDLEFCKCKGPVIRSKLDSSVTVYNCSRTNKSLHEEEIPVNHCTIKTSFLLQQISQKKVARMLQDPAEIKWIKGLGFENGSNIIWDIDEDFFGSEFPAEHIRYWNEDDWNWQNDIKTINELISDFICVGDSKHEMLGNHLLTSIFTSVPVSEVNSAKMVAAKQKILQMIRNHPSLFCDAASDQILEKWRNIAERLNEPLSSSKITRLIKFGFCMIRSIKSHDILKESKRVPLRICHELEKPTWFYQYAPFYTSKSSWFKNNGPIVNMEVFESLARALPKPGLITLSRSVRDGYTPRSNAGDIEKGVLKTLQNTVGISLNYDHDLLGGVQGWNAWSSRNEL